MTRWYSGSTIWSQGLCFLSIVAILLNLVTCSGTRLFWYGQMYKWTQMSWSYNCFASESSFQSCGCRCELWTQTILEGAELTKNQAKGTLWAMQLNLLERLKFAGVCGVLCWKSLNLVCVCVCVCFYLGLKMQMHLILFHKWNLKSRDHPSYFLKQFRFCCLLLVWKSACRKLLS